MFVVVDKQWAAPVIDGIVTAPGKPIEDLKFQLRPTVRVHGRYLAGPEGKPVVGQTLSLHQHGRSLLDLEGVTLPNPENSHRPVQPYVAQPGKTNEQGEFEFFVGPGNFTLSGPSQVRPKKFTITDETEIELNFAAARQEKGAIAGMVVTGEPPQPVANATVEGRYRTSANISQVRAKTDAQGRFEGERYMHRTVLYAKSPDGKLAGIIQIEHEDKEATIPIGPVASVKARVIDEATKAPLANARIQWGHPVYNGDSSSSWNDVFGGFVRTDDQGRFEVTGLVVGQEYFFIAPHEHSFAWVLKYTPKQAGEEDVGDLVHVAPKPPRVTERPRRRVAPPPERPLAERYRQALEEAPGLRQNILVVFYRKDSTADESWSELTNKDRQVRTALFDYRTLQVDVQAEGATQLAEQLGLSIAPDKLPAWSLRDSTGKLLEQGPIPLDPMGKLVNAAVVLEKLKHFAPEPLDAQKLLDEALADAKKTNRRVFVQETATWCGPCHMLARYLEAQRKIWEQDYIWVRMDHRWTGCYEVMAKIQEKRGGIPWFAILDADGKTLATSDGLNGNIGFPVEPLDTEYFIKILSSTKQRLTEDDLAELRKALEVIRKDLEIE
jgi:hypothetical protein